MNTNVEPANVVPPKIIPSFVAGFNTVANRIQLILLPILLDLLLLFAPQLRLKKLLDPIIAGMSQTPGLSEPEVVNFTKTVQEIWQSAADGYSLLNGLRSFPIGIPSLIAFQDKAATPLGTTSIFDVPSFAWAAVVWIALSCSGLVLGSLYFRQVALAVIQPDQGTSPKIYASIGQTFALTFAWLLMMLMLSVPALLLSPLVLLLGPAVAIFSGVAVLFVQAWVLVPLLFSPHGIHAYGQSALSAMLNSVRLTRLTFPGSGFFLIALYFFSQGMQQLWMVPPANSWMIFVAIAGHAFISTGLLAASFVYYRDGTRWMQEVIRNSVLAQQVTRI